MLVSFLVVCEHAEWKQNYNKKMTWWQRRYHWNSFIGHAGRGVIFYSFWSCIAFCKLLVEVIICLFCVSALFFVRATGTFAEIKKQRSQTQPSKKSPQNQTLPPKPTARLQGWRICLKFCCALLLTSLANITIALYSKMAHFHIITTQTFLRLCDYTREFKQFLDQNVGNLIIQKGLS